MKNSNVFKFSYFEVTALIKKAYPDECADVKITAMSDTEIQKIMTDYLVDNGLVPNNINLATVTCDTFTIIFQSEVVVR